MVSFTWTPNSPNVNETTQFTDTSKCWDEDAVNGADCSTTTGDAYSWTLNGATPATSTAENPTAKFANPGPFNVTLQVTDRDGHTCSITQTVRANYPLPKWKEIKPW
jgi:PKD repeat protein